MSKIYIDTPESISISSVIENNCTFSSSQYKQLIMANRNFKYVKDFLSRPLKRSDLGNEIGSINYIGKSPYYFMRTKAMQPHTYLPEITSETVLPIMPSAFKSSHLKEGDIIISKDSNIGEVVILDKDYPNYMLSGALYKLPVEKHKYYLLAFIKHEIFRQQLDFMVPKGATIRHAKTMFLDCKIPIPNNNRENVIAYIETLMKAIINKEKLIRERHRLILKEIQYELLNNQKGNIYNYEFPRINEITEVNRLDTARYSKEYKEYEFLLKNYIYGASNLTKLGYKTKRGQNLQVSNIGISYYSKEMKKNFYRLAVSSNFSEYSTIEKFEYIGNPRRLSEINVGDIVFSARGAQFGRCVVFSEKVEKLITNIDSIVIYNAKNMVQSIFIALMLNNYRQNKHIYRVAITGSGANSLTQYQVDDILFPNFPEQKQKEIAALYHNPQIVYNSKHCLLDTFFDYDRKFNDTAGIYELDKTVKALKARLDEIIDDIIYDREVNIKFDFMSC